MKTSTILSVFWIISLLFISGCSESKRNIAKNDNDYYVAAYIWPSCHDEQMSRDFIWGEGIGEWEIIQKCKPRFEGHYQPRLPLWGYEMDDDPVAVEKKINAATAHGVNVFIYDWYWYDGKPFLEEALNEGFLKAGNNQKMQFYLMWANHDVPGNMWNPYRYKTDSLIWKGVVDWDNYKKIVARVIKQYFGLNNYFKIDGKPVFSIYHLSNFVKSFNGLEGARAALEYFREEVKKAGFPDLHVQLVGHDSNGKPLLLTDLSDLERKIEIKEIISILDINSVTMYNMVGLRRGDYLNYGERGIKLREKWDSELKVPFFPCVSIGWDNTPRNPDYGKEKIISSNNTPKSFATFLQKSKEYADNHPEQPKLIVINAWNEWVEGSYLEPDMLWGFGYLEAVKKVMSGEYEKY